MEMSVRNVEYRSRYELERDGEVIAVADYRMDGDVVVLHHTEVVRDLRGQGYGAALVQGALDDLRRRGKRVVPVCWYVREFMGANEGYDDLVA